MRTRFQYSIVLSTRSEALDHRQKKEVILFEYKEAVSREDTVKAVNEAGRKGSVGR